MADGRGELPRTAKGVRNERVWVGIRRLVLARRTKDMNVGTKLSEFKLYIPTSIRVRCTIYKNRSSIQERSHAALSKLLVWSKVFSCIRIRGYQIDIGSFRFRSMRVHSLDRKRISA